MEAQLCAGEEVIVVGGGNSAGQAAVFLAQTARRVHMLVRGRGLADTMSRYLIRRIEENPAIALRTRTRDRRSGGKRTARTRPMARRRHRRDRDTRHRSRLHDDRRRPEHAMARRLPGARREGVRQDRSGSLVRTISRPAHGRSHGRRFCSRPAARASLRSATCAAATSSAWRRRSAKDRLPSRFVHQVLRQ